MTPLKLVFLAGVVAVVSVLLIEPAMAGTKCSDKRLKGHTPIGFIPYPHKRDALSAARQDWVRACTNLTVGPGLNYVHRCDWVKAKNKKSACNRVPNGVGGYNYSCKFNAYPCWSTPS